MGKTLRPGTHINVLTDEGRIRHVRVIDVDDQDNVDVLLGYAGNETSQSFAADRVVSTKTRGNIFSEE